MAMAGTRQPGQSDQSYDAYRRGDEDQIQGDSGGALGGQYRRVLRATAIPLRINKWHSAPAPDGAKCQ
jgi:hypothetical protein